MTADCGDVLGSARLLTPGEVAKIFRVDPKTVTRWAKAGKLPSVETPGGHSRFWAADVQRMLEGRAPLGTGRVEGNRPGPAARPPRVPPAS